MPPKYPPSKIPPIDQLPMLTQEKANQYIRQINNEINRWTKAEYRSAALRKVNKKYGAGWKERILIRIIKTEEND